MAAQSATIPPFFLCEFGKKEYELPMAKYILEMNHITKEFPGVKALDDVNFKVEEGQIHCLVGENGAGKSTLMGMRSKKAAPLIGMKPSPELQRCSRESS